MSIPERGSAARLYQGESGMEYHEGKRALHSEFVPWVMELRAEKFQPHVRPGDTVFEYGSGAGWNLGRLICARRIAYDAATFLEARIQALGVEFIRDTALLGDETSDVVICHHVLEHLEAPVSALQELKRILKKGGKLLLHVPWEREWRMSRYSRSEPNHHLYTWNAQTLGNLLTISGLSVRQVGVRRYGYDRFAANLAGKLRLGSSGYRFIRRMMVTARPLHEVEAICVKE